MNPNGKILARLQMVSEPEGWLLFDVDGFGLLIQKCDSRDAFDSDDAAVAHVATCARAGSWAHLTAMQIHTASVASHWRRRHAGRVAE